MGTVPFVYFDSTRYQADYSIEQVALEIDFQANPINGEHRKSLVRTISKSEQHPKPIVRTIPNKWASAQNQVAGHFELIVSLRNQLFRLFLFIDNP